MRRLPLSVPRFGLSFSFALALAACSSSSSVSAPAPGGTADDGGAEAARYALSSTVFSPEGDTTYVAVVSSLDAGDIDYARALEIAGAAFVYPIEGRAPSNALFVGSNEDMTIQRVDVGADGTLTPGAKLSLAGLGVTSQTFEGVLFLDERTAWYLDTTLLQVIVWDPTAMEIKTTFAAPELGRPGVSTAVGGLRPLGGSRYVAPVAWYDYEQTKALPIGAAAIFDASTNRLETVLEDARCGGLENAVPTDDGDVYFATGLFFPQIRQFLAPELPKTCILRIRAGEAVFDPGYALDVNAAVGNRTAGFLAGSGATDVWVQAWYPERYPTPPTFDERNSQDAWRWWRLDLRTGDAREEAGLDFHGGVAQAFVTEGTLWSSLVAPDYSRATLYRLGRDGTNVGLQVRGGLYGVTRVR